MAGQPGRPGLSVRPGVTLVSRQESGCVIPPHHSMEVKAVLGLTFRHATATLSPAQVPCLSLLRFATPSAEYHVQVLLHSCPRRRVSRGHDVYDGTRVRGSRGRVSTGVLGHDLHRGTVCHHLLRRLLLRPRLLPAQQQLRAPGTVPVLPPRGDVPSWRHPAC